MSRFASHFRVLPSRHRAPDATALLVDLDATASPFGARADRAPLE
jgi:hypothetical protein